MRRRSAASWSAGGVRAARCRRIPPRGDREADRGGCGHIEGAAVPRPQTAAKGPEPMSCPHMEVRLNEYADGTLADRDRAGVEAHLAECAECRAAVAQLRDLVAGARTLPRSVEPGRDLWSGIATRIAKGETGSGTRWIRVALAAAAVIVIALGLYRLLPTSTDLDRPAPGWVAVDADFDRATVELTRILATQRDRLSPETVALLERNLQVIDQAIAAALAAGFGRNGAHHQPARQAPGARLGCRYARRLGAARAADRAILRCRGRTRPDARARRPGRVGGACPAERHDLGEIDHRGYRGHRRGWDARSDERRRDHPRDRHPAGCHRRDHERERGAGGRHGTRSCEDGERRRAAPRRQPGPGRLDPERAHHRPCRRMAAWRHRRAARPVRVRLRRHPVRRRAWSRGGGPSRESERQDRGECPRHDRRGLRCGDDRGHHHEHVRRRAAEASRRWRWKGTGATVFDRRGRGPGHSTEFQGSYRIETQMKPTAALVCALAACAGTPPSGPPPLGETGNLQLQLVANGLGSPLYLTAPAADPRLFIVEQAGRIRSVRAGQLVGRPFLDIGDRVASGGEEGLLGLAFHPNYASNGYFYVNYTHLNGARDTLYTLIERYTVSASPDSADSASHQLILRIVQPYPNHNGGPGMS